MKTEIIAVVSAVVMVLAALVVVKYQEIKIERLAAEITRLNVEFAQTDKALAVCNDKVIKQNEAIATMAIDTETAKAKYEAKLEVARAEYGAIRKKLNTALAENPSCENERDLINEQLCLFMEGCL